MPSLRSLKNTLKQTTKMFFDDSHSQSSSSLAVKSIWSALAQKCWPYPSDHGLGRFTYLDDYLDNGSCCSRPADWVVVERRDDGCLMTRGEAGRSNQTFATPSDLSQSCPTLLAAAPRHHIYSSSGTSPFESHDHHLVPSIRHLRTIEFLGLEQAEKLGAFEAQVAHKFAGIVRAMRAAGEATGGQSINRAIAEKEEIQF